MTKKYNYLRANGDPITEVLEVINTSKTYFEGKVVLITGGARGIGKELVIGLASLAAKVFFIDKRELEGKDVVNEANAKGLFVKFIHQDVSEFDKLISIVEEITTNESSIDILINNAVEFVVKDFDSITPAEWEYSHKVNTTAPLVLSQLVLPKMIRNNFGVIINIIAVEGMPFAACMSSSKASLRSLTLSLSSEIVKNENVVVFGYAPGLVDTPLFFDHFPNYCEKKGLEFSDYVQNIVNNPGYEGLMPASHSAGALIWHMSNGVENHGLIRTPYHPLNKSGIINIKDEGNDLKPEEGNQNPARQYIIELDNYQNEIENKIKIRTEELQLEKIKTSSLLVAIEDKNKSIIDSINYTKRIQDAMLTSDKDRLNILPDSFVYYSPKDIVSGDFYRIDEIQKDNGDNLISFIVGDCTGHGVPGASLATLCISILKQSQKNPKIQSPGMALDYAKEQLNSFFNSSGSTIITDGMDVAFCAFSRKTNELIFSGANRPLYLLREGKIITYKGDRYSVGYDRIDQKFTSQTIKINKGDTVYLFSDGIVDQFGGKKGKKFMSKRFKDLILSIQKEDMERQHKIVEKTLLEWQGNLEQTDDICFMGVRF